MPTPFWTAATVGSLGVTAGTPYVANSADEAGVAAAKRIGTEQPASSKASVKQREITPVMVDRSKMVKIGRGENGGRSVTYTHVWLGEKPLGMLAGRHIDYTLAAQERDIGGANAHAVIVRDRAAGPILAGRMLPPA